MKCQVVETDIVYDPPKSHSSLISTLSRDCRIDASSTTMTTLSLGAAGAGAGAALSGTCFSSEVLRSLLLQIGFSRASGVGASSRLAWSSGIGASSS